jgi:hypothetical protein
MMKIPIQVAPVQRDISAARYATSSGIKPSENLCSCRGSWGSCVVNWNHCPDGYYQRCEAGVFTCLCWCCPNAGGPCLGPYE